MEISAIVSQEQLEIAHGCVYYRISPEFSASRHFPAGSPAAFRPGLRSSKI
jgi:hypothetical protein